MKTFKMIFSLAVFVFASSLFTSNAVQAQTAGGNASLLEFDAEDMENWDIAELPADTRDGRHVVATYKKNRTQLIATIKGGKIAEVGVLPVGGRYKVLTPSASPCSQIICPTFQIKHCFYTPWGTCVCICGAWITTAGGGN